MPRILDKLDAASGRTPEFLDNGVDYMTRRPGPAALLADGLYDAGWFDRFDGEFNLDDSSAFGIALQRWVHVAFDGPDHFIVLNLANLTRASNVALLIAEKSTGVFREASLTRLYPQDTVQAEAPFLHFHDPETGSFVRIDPDLSVMDLAIQADGLHLVAQARHALGRPFVQSTRFQRGRGAIQWYSIIELVHGLLAFDGKTVVLPPGTMGTVDRTVGHQRGIQAWNWIAAVGTATDLATGEVEPLGLQIAKDRKAARPVVDSRKYLAWTRDTLHKFAQVSFLYETRNTETNETGPWVITSDSGDVDLRFTPSFHRREEKRLMLVNADFNQYYGTVSGRVRLGERTLELHPCFAVCEESLLEL